MADVPAHETNVARMLSGDLFWSFTPELVAARERCGQACAKYNTAMNVNRRRRLELWKEITDDESPLPENDDDLVDEPWVESPVRIDYGTRVHLGKNIYINFNCVMLDSCPITIGSRTLIGPNCALYASSHPLDPDVRNGTKGPECAGPIVIGEDCWLGGNVVILPGVTLGRGVVVGAGSVVTKNVPDYHVVAGNPARIIKKLR